MLFYIISMEASKSPLITDAKLAARLGIKTAWLRSEADAGRLPHLKAGDRYLFDPHIIEQLLLERARGQESPKPEAGGQ